MHFMHLISLIGEESIRIYSSRYCTFHCSRIAVGGVSEEQLAKFHDQNDTYFQEAATAGGFPAKNLKVLPHSTLMSTLWRKTTQIECRKH